MYSCGLMFYSIFLEIQPWDNLQRAWDVAKKVQKGERPRLPKGTAFNKANATALLPSGVRKLVTDLWVERAADRPSASSVVQLIDSMFQRGDLDRPLEGKLRKGAKVRCFLALLRLEFANLVSLLKIDAKIRRTKFGANARTRDSSVRFVDQIKQEKEEARKEAAQKRKEREERKQQEEKEQAEEEKAEGSAEESGKRRKKPSTESEKKRQERKARSKSKKADKKSDE